MPDGVTTGSLTAAERRIERLLAAGYRFSYKPSERLVALIPPGKSNSWDGGAIWVRQSTLDSLRRKQREPTNAA